MKDITCLVTFVSNIFFFHSPPDYIQNGVGGYPDDGYMSPRGRPSPLHNGPIRQGRLPPLNGEF